MLDEKFKVGMGEGKAKFGVCLKIGPLNGPCFIRNFEARPNLTKADYVKLNPINTTTPSLKKQIDRALVF